MDAALPGGITGHVYHRVTTPAQRGPGDPIAGCRIRATEQTTKAVFDGKTDTGGKYRIVLPPGRYQVDMRACASGYLDCGDGYRKSAVFTAEIDGNWRTIDLTTHTCNKCLDADVRIATPDGEVPVSRLRIGDPIVVVGDDGRRVVATVSAVQRIVAARGAMARRMVLADGRTAVVSAPHPLGDGRLIGELVAGDRVDGAAIVTIEPAPYTDGYAYDLLPSADGAYIVNGIPMRTTMRRLAD